MRIFTAHKGDILVLMIIPEEMPSAVHVMHFKSNPAQNLVLKGIVPCSDGT